MAKRERPEGFLTGTERKQAIHAAMWSDDPETEIKALGERQGYKPGWADFQLSWMRDNVPAWLEYMERQDRLVPESKGSTKPKMRTRRVPAGPQLVDGERVLKECSTRDGRWHAVLVVADGKRFRVRWRLSSIVCCGRKQATMASKPFTIVNERIIPAEKFCRFCGAKTEVTIWVAPYEKVRMDFDAGRLVQARPDGANCWCQADVSYERLIG